MLGWLSVTMKESWERVLRCPNKFKRHTTRCNQEPVLSSIETQNKRNFLQWKMYPVIPLQVYLNSWETLRGPTASAHHQASHLNWKSLKSTNFTRVREVVWRISVYCLVLNTIRNEETAYIFTICSPSVSWDFTSLQGIKTTTERQKFWNSGSKDLWKSSPPHKQQNPVKNCQIYFCIQET